MSDEDAEVRSIVTPVRLQYSYTPGRASQRFLRAIARGRLMGQRCPECRKVYVPARGACPRCGVATREEVAVSDKGTVTTFCIVRVPSTNIQIPLPYAAAQILLDGADIPFGALLQECKPEELRMGMRVQAVWVPKQELGPTFESIRYFRPIDEPDVPFEKFKEHL